MKISLCPHYIKPLHRYILRALGLQKHYDDYEDDEDNDNEKHNSQF